jgi:hypothetical protein
MVRVMERVDHHPDFRVANRLLYFTEHQLLCIPEGHLKVQRLTKVIIDLRQAHSGTWAEYAHLRISTSGTGGPRWPPTYSSTASRVVCAR